MMAKELQDWFPEAQISDQPVEKEGYLTLPLASQQWILLEEAGLSEREKQLVALLTQQEQARSLNPWYPYLIEGKGQAPQAFKKIQLVYCHLSYFQQENLASWLDMMRTLFPNYLTTIQVGLRIISLFSSRISISLLVRFYQILSKRLSMTLDFVCLLC